VKSGPKQQIACGISRSPWRLKQLFSISIEGLSRRLLFKGGTSLSKIFHAMNRFSEDIDLAVDYEALGFKGERDPRRQDISR
jgi:predicted nucleotidyltransferase component of viral defense system